METASRALIVTVLLAFGAVASAEGPSAPGQGGAPMPRLGPPGLAVRVGGRVARELPPAVRRTPWRPSFLPASFAIPDLYAVDPGDRDPPVFAAPVDGTRYGALNLLPRRMGRLRALSLVYERESLPGPGDSSSLIRLELEVGF